MEGTSRVWGKMDTKLAQVLSAVEHLSPRKGQQPAGGPEQRGLAAAVGAYQGGDFPRLESKVHILQHRAAGVPGGDVAQLYHPAPPFLPGRGRRLCLTMRNRKKGPPKKLSKMPTGIS